MSWWLYNRGSYKNRFSVSDEKPKKMATSPKKIEQDGYFAEFLETHASKTLATHIFSNGLRYIEKYSQHVAVEWKGDARTPDQEELIKHIHKYHDIGFNLPLLETLGESAKLRLWVDLEAVCPKGKDEEDKAWGILTGDLLTCVMRKLLHVFAPTVIKGGIEGYMEFFLLRSSGTDPDGLTKCCCRIVSCLSKWRDPSSGNPHESRLVVDKETMKIIMGALAGDLDKLLADGNAGITRAKDELLALDAKNTFKNLVSKSSLESKSGVCLPYCDEYTEKPGGQSLPSGRPYLPRSKLKMKVGEGWEEDYNAWREQGKPESELADKEEMSSPSIEHLGLGDLVQLACVTWTDADAVSQFNTGALRH